MRVVRSEEVQFGKDLSRGLNCCLALLPGTARTNCSCHYYQCLPEVGRAVSHHPPPAQNCYAVSSISSWPIPVRGVHHDKGGRYYALYSEHKVVPVQQ